MASMRDIKRRKASIQSTGQITKAMKLVSTVKLSQVLRIQNRILIVCMKHLVKYLVEWRM